MIRLDDAGALYFAREGDRAKPVRLIQIQLAPADRNTPMLLALLDEAMDPTDPGTAQNHDETLLSPLPFGLHVVETHVRLLYGTLDSLRAASLPHCKSPRYPGG